MRILSIVALFVFVGAATAEEKKLAGSWTKKIEGFELKIAFMKGDLLQFSMNDGNNGCTLDAKYTVEKDGTIKCEVTKFEKKGNFPVEKEKGYKFSFKFEIKDKAAKMTNMEGMEIDDEAKMAIEGDYEKGLIEPIGERWMEAYRLLHAWHCPRFCVDYATRRR